MSSAPEEGEKKTWKDFAAEESQTEDPYLRLVVDPARWDPVTTQVRRERITNTLLDLYRQYGDNQKAITDLGVKSGDDYKALRGAQLIVEGKIKACEQKLDTLKSRSIMKNQELKGA